MAGKMTILDRLVNAGKIKPSSSRDLRVRGEFFDPLQYTTQQRILMQGAPERAYMAVPQNGVGRDIKLTPERQVYQRGIEALIDTRKKPIQEKYDDTMGELSDLQDEFENAFGEAKENYVEQVRDNMDSRYTPDIRGGFNPHYDFEVNVGRETLEDYWPDYDYKPVDYYNSRGEELGDLVSEYERQLDALDKPAYRMQLQTQSPRYRNYQRAMQQRAANKRMGHQLSRMWGDAYNRLRARGLSDDEARMYLHSYFGGR